MNIAKFFIVAGMAAIPFTAQAADLPNKKKTPQAPPEKTLQYDWSGFYIGVNGGYSDANSSYKISEAELQDLNLFPLGTVSGDFIQYADSKPLWSRHLRKGGSLTGGIQTGFNYQINNIVIGLEADTNWMGNHEKLTHSATGIVANPSVTLNDGTFVVKSSLSQLSTLRGRLGLAFDKIMLFTTAGFALGAVKSSTNNNTIWAEGTQYADRWYLSGEGSKNLPGWVVGGGAEYAINKNVTAKAEAIYYDLASLKYSMKETTLYDTNHIGGTNKVSVNGYLVRVGLNYKF